MTGLKGVTAVVVKCPDNGCLKEFTLPVKVDGILAGRRGKAVMAFHMDRTPQTVEYVKHMLEHLLD